jgi:enoyl-CoA hydratase/carnithine racemase
MHENVVLSIDDRVMTIHLNRPEARNSLTSEMCAALTDALVLADESRDIRCIVITGGGRSFTVGIDYELMPEIGQKENSPALRFVETLRDLETPIIAAANGTAIGVGLTMLLHCDLVFASATARFSAPFGRIGLVPEAGSSLLLPLALGNAWANDLLLSGRVLRASEALSAGLVSRVVPADELLPLCLGVAKKIAGFAPNAIVESKRLIRSGRALAKEQMSKETPLFRAQLNSSEFTESLASLFERRQPVFD